MELVNVLQYFMGDYTAVATNVTNVCAFLVQLVAKRALVSKLLKYITKKAQNSLKSIALRLLHHINYTTP